MEKRFQEYCQINYQNFYLEDSTQIDWSISKKKQNNGSAYETNKN